MVGRVGWERGHLRMHISCLAGIDGTGGTYLSSILQGKTLDKLNNSGHTRASRPLFQKQG